MQISEPPGKGPCTRWSGFAYLGVLFGVALLSIGLLATIHIEANFSQRVRENELLSIGRQFRDALRIYQEGTTLARAAGVELAPFETPESSQALGPVELEDLLRDTRLGVLRRPLRKIFVDPMTGKAEWRVIRVAGRIVGIHSLSAQKPLKQSGFEDDDVAFTQAARYSDWIFTWPAESLKNDSIQSDTVSPVSP